MSIKTRLTLIFTALTASILLVFAAFTYISAAGDRKAGFFNHLQKEAITRANVLLDARVDAEILQTIYRQNRKALSEVEVAIYEPDFTLLYHDAIDIDFVKETPEMIDEIINKGQIRFTQEGWQVVGLLFEFADRQYVITAAAFDEYGHAKLSGLLNTLLFSWLGGVLVIFFVGWLFARNALKPVSEMAEKAGTITATNLDLRLGEGNGRDELAELAITFNHMLDRLENSFDAQKQFVSNIAHELRTPLAALISEIDLSLMKERDADAYRTALEQVQQDARKLRRLSDGLLDLARASYDDTRIGLKSLRVDEALMDARQELLKNNPEYAVSLTVDEMLTDDSMVTVSGNAYLLRVAFANLMDNACKFSADGHCRVSLESREQRLLVCFADEGIGIDEEDQPHVFTPFYRGRNRLDIHGSGIGLPLVQRIVNLHRAEITLESSPGKGTLVQVRFPVSE